MRCDYWCEAIALTGDRACWLARHQATSARLALRWLKHQTRAMVDQLDASAATAGRRWLADETAQAEALLLLVEGEWYGLVLADGPTRYLISARPTGHPQ
ncbi:hypothetical protein ACFVIM_04280 [Streptomyces sp. NPDC057638]|uniref:hypothetical protein n=1 Tax=Streptomyces sp. NPDC057638 TaxID=3346190 RepID=UPI0036D0A4CA